MKSLKELRCKGQLLQEQISTLKGYLRFDPLRADVLWWSLCFWFWARVWTKQENSSLFTCRWTQLRFNSWLKEITFYRIRRGRENAEESCCIEKLQILINIYDRRTRYFSLMLSFSLLARNCFENLPPRLDFCVYTPPHALTIISHSTFFDKIFYDKLKWNSFVALCLSTHHWYHLFLGFISFLVFARPFWVERTLNKGEEVERTAVALWWWLSKTWKHL